MRWRAGSGLVGAVAVSASLSSCGENRFQNALVSSGVQASHIERLWWFALSTAALIYVVVIAAVFYAAVHRKRHAPAHVLPEHPDEERTGTRWVVIAVGATIAVLFLYLVLDLFTSRSLSAMQQQSSILVKVTGFQWWWRIEYVDKQTNRSLLTANELHVPVGANVEIELETGDVIHSFWAPSLSGKRDLVPGHKNRVWMKADTAGIYRGQCAEFCGHQHAKMAFLVIAQPRAQFDSWYNSQLKEAEVPSDTLRQQGQDAFMGNACPVCHQIRGTPASGHVAPDLTHIGSRLTLAAGTIPNTRGHLGGWIVNPQAIKPGTRMPPNALESHELQALIAYLEGLK